MMQYFGTDVIRNTIRDTFWVDRFKYEYDNAPVVIADVRFQNEIDMIHELGGIVIKLERVYKDDVFSRHRSEAIDLLRNIDYVIFNNKSIKDLQQRFIEIYENLKSYNI